MKCLADDWFKSRPHERACDDMVNARQNRALNMALSGGYNVIPGRHDVANPESIFPASVVMDSG